MCPERSRTKAKLGPGKDEAPAFAAFRLFLESGIPEDYGLTPMEVVPAASIYDNRGKRNVFVTISKHSSNVKLLFFAIALPRKSPKKFTYV